MWEAIRRGFSRWRHVGGARAGIDQAIEGKGNVQVGAVYGDLCVSNRSHITIIHTSEQLPEVLRMVREETERTTR